MPLPLTQAGISAARVRIQLAFDANKISITRYRELMARSYKEEIDHRMEHPTIHDERASPELIADMEEALASYEAVMTEVKGKTVTAIRTRTAIRDNGIVRYLEKSMTSKKVSPAKALALSVLRPLNTGKTFEDVVIKHSALFSAEACHYASAQQSDV